MSTLTLPKPKGFGQTSRRDGWWVAPLLTFLGFMTFIVYSTWAAFQNAHFESGPYLSPFYAPLLFGPAESGHVWFPLAEGATHPSWYPSFLPWSPAFLILWIPGGFRFTCYYYRGAYYKAFWADPINCAVGEPRKSYWGENSLPLILQNLHRYFFYLAAAFIFLLAYDAWKGMWFGPAGEEKFGIGVGTVILWTNVFLLGAYTFGCHSFRHLIGGFKNSFSQNPMRKNCYDCVSGLNKKHMLFAWCSLFSVGFCDVYVRLCSMGIWTDFMIFGGNG
ncbi:MAG: succinate dehydrogenase [Planctomycetota bacterium]